MSEPQNGPFQLGSAIWPGLGKLMEEAGETLQVLGKLVATGGREAHWDGTNLRIRLREELADLDAALTFFIDNNFGPDEYRRLADRASAKVERFKKWAIGVEDAEPTPERG